MTEIRLHPDGYPVMRAGKPEPYGVRWYGVEWHAELGLRAKAFTDGEAADWPRLEVVDDRA